MKYNLDTWEGRYAAVHNMAAKKFGENAVYGIIGTPTLNTSEYYQKPFAMTAIQSKKHAGAILSKIYDL